MYMPIGYNLVVTSVPLTTRWAFARIGYPLHANVKKHPSITSWYCIGGIYCGDIVEGGLGWFIVK